MPAEQKNGQRQGTGWPTPVPWNAGGELPAQPDGGEPVARRGWPPADWPSQAQLTYTKELITVVLLLLALPWLMSKLVTRPSDVLAGVGQRAMGRAGSG